MRKIGFAPASFLFLGLTLGLGFGLPRGAPALAASGDALVVTGDRVNVRDGPSTDAGVKLRVHHDQRVTELQREGDWVRVEIAGTGDQDGWIHGSLLGPATAASESPAAATIEPAAAAGDDPAELARFRQSVEYLNGRALSVAGVDLFTTVEAAGDGVVQVAATEAWSTIPPAGQQSYANTLLDRWAAARGYGGPVSIQIVDPEGEVLLERTRP